MTKFTKSFVVSNVPFIGHSNPPVLPFVGQNMPFERKRGKQAGFTLIELLTVVVIAGILAVIAGPAFRDLSLNNQLVAQTNDLLADLLYMRSEALKRSKTLYMCKSTDPTAIPPVCDTTATDPWTTGWFIYADGNGDGAFTYKANPSVANGDDFLLRVSDGFPGNNKKIITTTNGGTGDLDNYIAIDRLGLLTTPNDTWGYFSICDGRGVSFGKRVDLATTGRARINRKDAPSC